MFSYLERLTNRIVPATGEGLLRRTLPGGVLIAFGIVVIVLAINGRNTVHDELKRQQITGTPDMTPTAIKAEGAKAGLENVSYPTCTVAGEPVDTGNEARCFAQYMNIHALEASGGFTYSQTGIYSAKPSTPKSQLEPGGGTSNAQYAQTDPRTGQPVQNASRNVWVTETALSTVLNVSYMATQLSLSLSSSESHCCSPASASSFSLPAARSSAASRRGRPKRSPGPVFKKDTERVSTAEAGAD